MDWSVLICGSAHPKFDTHAQLVVAIVLVAQLAASLVRFLPGPRPSFLVDLPSSRVYVASKSSWGSSLAICSCVYDVNNDSDVNLYYCLVSFLDLLT